MKYYLTVFFLSLFSIVSYSQNSISSVSDTINSNQEIKSVDTLVNTVLNVDGTVPDSTALLPKHYLFTQRILWGEKGLMRNINMFKLSESERDREMSIRSTMISLHQYFGYATLVSMIGNGIVGQRLYTGQRDLKDLHSTLAGTTDFFYFSTAALSLFAPPPMKDRSGGITNLNVHRALSILHLTSMIATNVLSGMVEDNPSLKPYHRAAAITAFGSLFLATVIIKL